mmetsp:Transcript_18236/g.63263  ORF Transcript_18236/g.63263 Transcript_18236/m.63263 type:complete len:218 (-) Transcript_18236:54-707(-)
MRPNRVPPFFEIVPRSSTVFTPRRIFSSHSGLTQRARSGQAPRATRAVDASAASIIAMIRSFFSSFFSSYDFPASWDLPAAASSSRRGGASRGAVAGVSAGAGGRDRRGVQARSTSPSSPASRSCAAQYARTSDALALTPRSSCRSARRRTGLRTAFKTSRSGAGSASRRSRIRQISAGAAPSASCTRRQGSRSAATSMAAMFAARQERCDADRRAI